MGKKRNRQETIKRIVREKAIHTQSQLVDELGQMGFKVTQATISRDVNQLSLEKVPSDAGRSIYILAEDRHLRRMCEDLVKWTKPSGNVVVCKTTPGGASSVAQAVDAAQWEESVGTIAGDDTFIVIAESDAAARVVAARIEKLAR